VWQDLAMHVEMIPEAISGLSEGVGASVSLVRIIRDHAGARVDKDHAGIRGESRIVNDNSNALSALNSQAALELVDVSFSYPSRLTVAVIKELSLRVQFGHTVAIVGKSGSGKTSLISLLLRLYATSEV
jgi:ABC-type multidrug transport system fused ATPase/permease subunit